MGTYLLDPALTKFSARIHDNRIYAVRKFALSLSLVIEHKCIVFVINDRTNASFQKKKKNKKEITFLPWEIASIKKL